MGESKVVRTVDVTSLYMPMSVRCSATCGRTAHAESGVLDRPFESYRGARSRTNLAPVAERNKLNHSVGWTVTEGKQIPPHDLDLWYLFPVEPLQSFQT